MPFGGVEALVGDQRTPGQPVRGPRFLGREEALGHAFAEPGPAKRHRSGVPGLGVVQGGQRRVVEGPQVGDVTVEQAHCLGGDARPVAGEVLGEAGAQGRIAAFADLGQGMVEQPAQAQVGHHPACGVDLQGAIPGRAPQAPIAVQAGPRPLRRIRRQGRRRGLRAVPCRGGGPAPPPQGGHAQQGHQAQPGPPRTHRPRFFSRLAWARSTLAGLGENRPRRPRNWFTSSPWFQT